MDDIELQRLVEEISLAEFGKPFRHKAYFNSRLKTTGGRYMLSTHHVEINRIYLEQLGHQELCGIIKHELCHYHLHIEGKGYKHRDQDFKMLMKAVGAPRFCSPRESMRRGYMEMAKINLTIASEAFQAEFEAEHTVERLVSGG